MLRPRVPSHRTKRLAQRLVARASDRRLEQVVGSRAGLALTMRGLERAYVPGALDGFTGELGLDLRRGEALVPWTVRVARGRATATPGPADRPAVRLRLSVADLARIATGELDAVKALLAGRLDVEGDFLVASRLGELFGRAPRG